MSLPSGFAYANELQAFEFEASGSVHGASKVTVTPDGLAVRLRPPRTLEDVVSPCGGAGPIDAAQYIAEYNGGWQASTRVGRTGEPSKAWDSGMTSGAWDDGYLDQAAGRPKWHLAYCSDHDACGEA